MEWTLEASHPASPVGAFVGRLAGRQKKMLITVEARRLKTSFEFQFLLSPLKWTADGLIRSGADCRSPGLRMLLRFLTCWTPVDPDGILLERPCVYIN